MVYSDPQARSIQRWHSDRLQYLEDNAKRIRKEDPKLKKQRQDFHLAKGLGPKQKEWLKELEGCAKPVDNLVNSVENFSQDKELDK